VAWHAKNWLRDIKRRYQILLSARHQSAAADTTRRIEGTPEGATRRGDVVFAFVNVLTSAQLRKAATYYYVAARPAF
jgi:hypothetical protein